MNFLIVFLGVLTTFLLGDRLIRSRERRAAKTRDPHRLDDFVGYFSAEGIPSRISVEVHSYFKNLQQAKEFPVHPEDDLYKVYGIWNEDLDDAVLELAERCGRKIPVSKDVQNMPPVRTLADLVRLLSLLESRE